jgi:hypothetical protein
MKPLSDLLAAATIAAAVGGGAFIVARSKIGMPLRGLLRRRSADGWVWAKSAELVVCPFCLSVWMAGFACLIYPVRLIHGRGPLDWLVTSLAVSAVSMLPVHIINLAVTTGTAAAPKLPKRRVPPPPPKMPPDVRRVPSPPKGRDDW